MSYFRPIHKFTKQTEAIYQTEDAILSRVIRIIGLIVALVIVHSFAMVLFEDMSPSDALWVSITTITTVGYGDLSAHTLAGRISTILLLYVFGIILLWELLSEYLNYKIIKRDQIIKGEWRWNMVEHILILNAPIYNAEQYFVRLISQIRENEEYSRIPIQILTTEFESGLPTALRELGVVFYRGSPNSSADLEKVDVCNAQHILVLAKHEYAAGADSTTFDVAHRLMEMNVLHKAHVECVLDENRARLKKLGARSILRPIRSYPEIIVQALVAPGSETLLEDHFTYKGDHPKRYVIFLENYKWSDIVCAIIKEDLGTAMAYIDKQGETFPHPGANEIICAVGLIVMVNAESIPKPEEIVRVLNPLSRFMPEEVQKAS